MVSEKTPDVRVIKSSVSSGKKVRVVLEVELVDEQVEELPITVAPLRNSDLIKVLAGLHHLGLFCRPDGSKVTCKELMDYMGQVLGVNLSNYRVLLSKARDTHGPAEVIDELHRWAKKKFLR